MKLSNRSVKIPRTAGLI
uniref:Uncharacterized protein n=1 Tax=Arundo donax TaxID=35708 RepID=A0A0A9EEH7_ARUDO